MNKSGRSADEMKHVPSKNQSYKNAQFQAQDNKYQWGFFFQNSGNPDFILVFFF